MLMIIYHTFNQLWFNFVTGYNFSLIFNKRISHEKSNKNIFKTKHILIKSKKQTLHKDASYRITNKWCGFQDDQINLQRN